MKKTFVLTAASFFIFVFAVSIFAQVATKTGSIYGKVVDDKKEPLPGVSITLESVQVAPRTATLARFYNISKVIHTFCSAP